MNDRAARQKQRRDMILFMLENGKTRTQTGRALGCSSANVSQIVKRYAPKAIKQRFPCSKGWGGRVVAKMQPEHIEFVVSEAKANGVSPEIMARSLLVDAIFEAMEGK